LRNDFKTVTALLVLDLDGTLTPVRSSWRFLHIKLGSYFRAIKYYQLFFDGYITYDEWVYLDLSLWKGIKKSVIEKLLSEIPWRSGARELASLRSYGCYTLVVSGGLDMLARRAVEELALDDYIAVSLDVDADGRVTGFSSSYIDFHGKGEAVKNYLEEKKLAPKMVISVGDSRNDIDLFKASDLAIAFCPENPDIARYAHYVVSDCDLSKVKKLVLKTILEHAWC